MALSGVGLFLVYDAVTALIRTEHPTIGSVDLFGTTVWQGWLMIAALAYSVVLPVIFGRLKMHPARLREEGRFVTGTIYVEPRGGHIDPDRVRDAEARLRGLHWRVAHVAIMPVPDIGDVLDGQAG